MFAWGAEYGSPYCYALPCVVRERFEEPELSGKIGLVEYVGVHKPMTPAIYRALFEAMAGAGWGVLSTRIKDGEQRAIELRQAYWDRKEYNALTGDSREVK